MWNQPKKKMGLAGVALFLLVLFKAAWKTLIAVLSPPFIPVLHRSEMKRWMILLSPNRRTKFVSFTSRLVGKKKKGDMRVDGQLQPK